MQKRKTTRGRGRSQKTTPKGPWQLQVAKARFSELFRRALSEGPQLKVRAVCCASFLSHSGERIGGTLPTQFQKPLLCKSSDLMRCASPRKESAPFTNLLHEIALWRVQYSLLRPKLNSTHRAPTFRLPTAACARAFACSTMAS
jgi:hypothetical protein